MYGGVRGRENLINFPSYSIEERGIDKDNYSVSIPLGATINMAGAGFVVGVIQDSCEIVLNSSTDAFFTAVAEFGQWRKEGKKIVITSKR